MEIALRFDTEDFLTLESDGALEALLDVLDRHDAAATFPLVAEKVRSWERLGRAGGLLRRLRRHATGYHSATHSVHPTIAEELAPLSWEAAQEAFAAREADGFAAVTAAAGSPACWTQPGGNWTAAALPVLRRWGVGFEFSEQWNSYLDFGGGPCHFAGLLHWSPPVAAPKPFLSALPGCLDGALQTVAAALEASPGTPVCVVAHPTELCTTAFWDAANFGAGRQPPRADWRPAPLRPPTEVAAAAAALDRYVGGLRAMGCGFVTAADVAARFPDRARGARLDRAEVAALAGCVLERAGPAVRGALSLSAAEILDLVCRALADGRSAGLEVRHRDGPAEAPPERVLRGPVPREDLVAAAAWTARHLEERARVPDAVPIGHAVAAPADLLGAAARALREPEAAAVALRRVPLPAADAVKEPARLHWDWPVFPPGFAPLGLWRQARLQAWTLKPALRVAAPGADRWRPWPAGGPPPQGPGAGAPNAARTGG